VTGKLPRRRPELLLLESAGATEPPLEPPDEDEEPPEEEPLLEPPPPDETAVPLDDEPAGAECCPLAGRGVASAAMLNTAAAMSVRFMSSSGERPTRVLQQLNCQRCSENR
jgi:hypothetical protein